MADKCLTYVGSMSDNAKSCFGFAFGVLTGVAIAASSVVILKKKTQSSRCEIQINSHVDINQQLDTMRAQVRLERDRYNRLRDMSKRAAQIKSSHARKQTKNAAQKYAEKERHKGSEIKGPETKCAHQFPRKIAITHNLKYNHKRQQKSISLNVNMRGRGGRQSRFASPIAKAQLPRVEEENSAGEISDAEENCRPSS